MVLSSVEEVIKAAAIVIFDGGAGINRAAPGTLRRTAIRGVVPQSLS
jgi:hypothetical protein